MKKINPSLNKIIQKFYMCRLICSRHSVDHGLIHPVDHKILISMSHMSTLLTQLLGKIQEIFFNFGSLSIILIWRAGFYGNGWISWALKFFSIFLNSIFYLSLTYLKLEILLVEPDQWLGPSNHNISYKRQL